MREVKLSVTIVVSPMRLPLQERLPARKGRGALHPLLARHPLYLVLTTPLPGKESSETLLRLGPKIRLK